MIHYLKYLYRIYVDMQYIMIYQCYYIDPLLSSVVSLVCFRSVLKWYEGEENKKHVYQTKQS